MSLPDALLKLIIRTFAAPAVWASAMARPHAARREWVAFMKWVRMVLLQETKSGCSSQWLVCQYFWHYCNIGWPACQSEVSALRKTRPFPVGGRSSMIWVCDPAAAGTTRGFPGVV